MFSSKTKKVVFKVKPVAVAKGLDGEKYFVKIGKDKTRSYESGKNGVVKFDTEAERFYRIGNLVKNRVFLPEQDKVTLYKEGPKKRRPVKVGEALINYVDFLNEDKVYADFALYNKDGQRTTLRIFIKRTWKHEYNEPDQNEKNKHGNINSEDEESSDE